MLSLSPLDFCLISCFFFIKPIPSLAPEHTSGILSLTGSMGISVGLSWNQENQVSDPSDD